MTSPFDWKGKPSIFSKDKQFTPTKDGKVRSVVASETVEKVYAQGINHGTMHGISKEYDALASAREFHKRRETNKKLKRPKTVEPFSKDEPDPFREARETIAKIRARKK